jgi:molecular chaperone DnaK
MLREHGDKISASDKSNVESALADAKKALEGSDASAMNSAREKLTAASHKLAEQMYKSAQAAGAAGGAQAGGPAPGADGAARPDGQKKEGEVIDAEYVDVDEKK